MVESQPGETDENVIEGKIFHFPSDHKQHLEGDSLKCSYAHTALA